MSHKKGPLRANDKRRPGLSDNVRVKVDAAASAGDPLMDIFNDRRKPNGHGKRSST